MFAPKLKEASPILRDVKGKLIPKVKPKLSPRMVSSTDPPGHHLSLKLGQAQPKVFLYKRHLHLLHMVCKSSWWIGRHFPPVLHLLQAVDHLLLSSPNQNPLSNSLVTTCPSPASPPPPQQTLWPSPIDNSPQAENLLIRWKNKQNCSKIGRSKNPLKKKIPF